jgi:hypothetical protein
MVESRILSIHPRANQLVKCASKIGELEDTLIQFGGTSMSLQNGFSWSGRTDCVHGLGPDGRLYGHWDRDGSEFGQLPVCASMQEQYTCTEDTDILRWCFEPVKQSLE